MFVVERTDFHEVADGGKTGEADGFKALDLVAERAGEFAVDVERAAAHAGDGAHFLDARIGEFADDQGFAGAEGVLEDAGDFDGEGLDFLALENSPDFAALTGLDLGEGKRGGIGRLGEDRDGEE